MNSQSTWVSCDFPHSIIWGEIPFHYSLFPLFCYQVTAYGGDLQYTVRFEPLQRSNVVDGKPDVVLQGNGIFLEHYSQTKPPPRVPQTVTVTFREVCFIAHKGVSFGQLNLGLTSCSLFSISLWLVVFVASRRRAAVHSRAPADGSG